MALTPEQEYYFDQLEDLFAMPGFKLLVEEAKAQIYEYQAMALEQPNWDAVNELRGRAKQLAEFTNLEEVTAIQKSQLEEGDDDADL